MNGRRPARPQGPRAYRPGLLVRLGPGATEVIRAGTWSLPLAIPTVLVVAWHLTGTGWGVAPALVAGLFAGVVAVLISAAVASLIGHGAGVGFGGSLWPSGDSTPRVEEFSLAQSLVARGDLAGGLALLERRVREAPGDTQARIAAADLYALRAADPGRARIHLEAVLRRPAVPPREARYAASRLVDLYLGPLADHAASARRVREIDRLHPGLVPPGSLPPEGQADQGVTTDGFPPSPNDDRGLSRE